MSVGRQSSSQSSTGSSSGHSMGYNESGGINLGLGTSSSTGAAWNSSKSTPGFMTELGTILQRNLDGTGEFSKNQAIADVQGVIRTQAQDALQSALPSVARVNRGAGAYNTTTNTLLENDRASRVNAQLANTQLEAIKSYGQLGNQQIAAFSGATQAGTTTESSCVSSQSSQSDHQIIGLNSTLGLQEALQQGANESSGSGSGFNVGLPSGKADGGAIPEKRTKEEIENSSNLAARSLLEFGTSPFSLLNEYFKFGSSSGRKSGLTVLPELLGFLGGTIAGGLGLTQPAQTDQSQSAAAPAPAQAPAAKQEKLSPEATKFMEMHGYKTLEEADRALTMMVRTNTAVQLPETYNEGGAFSAPEFQKQAQLMRDTYGSTHGGAYFAADGGKLVNNTTPTQSSSNPVAWIRDNIQNPVNEFRNDLQQYIRQFVGEDIWGSTRERREREAGLTPQQGANGGGVVINVNAPSPQQSQEYKPYGGFEYPGGTLQGRANGGQITDSVDLMRALQHYAAGGQVPHIMEQTNSAGKLTGPQSKSGRDNQLVAVAGGEGVIPKDVMEVDGVPQLLQQLIQKYHTPVR